MMESDCGRVMQIMGPTAEVENDGMLYQKEVVRSFELLCLACMRTIGVVEFLITIWVEELWSESSFMANATLNGSLHDP